MLYLSMLSGEGHNVGVGRERVGGGGWLRNEGWMM